MGSSAGFLLSLAFARALSGMLFGTSPLDPVTLSSVVMLVLALLMGVTGYSTSEVDPARHRQVHGNDEIKPFGTP